nr:EamA family transporter [Actinoplanes sp. NBRC 103695]
MRSPDSRPGHSAGPALTTAAVALLWGTSGGLVRFLALPAAEIACLRAAVGAVTLAAVLAVRSRAGRTSAISLPRRHLPSLVLSGTLLAAHWLTFVMALQRAPIGTVLTGIYVAPVLITVLARRTLNEKVDLGKRVAVLLAVAGSALVLRPAAAGGWDGILLTLFSAAAYAGSILASKKTLAATSPMMVAAAQLATTAIILAPIMLVGFVPLAAYDAVVLGVLGAVYSAIAMWAYLAALRGLSTTTSAILLCLEPVSAFITGWLFLGEKPSPLTAVGAVTVLAASTYATLKWVQEEKRPELDAPHSEASLK